MKKKQETQNKEAVKALLQSCVYKEALDILLDKYIKNFLEKEFIQEVSHPNHNHLKENLRKEVLDEATSHMAETIEMVYGKESKLYFR